MDRGKKKNIIFISHDSTLTGAPILLLNLLKWVKQTGKYNFRIILMRGGPLEEEFKKIGDITIIKPSNYNQQKSILRKGFYFLDQRIRRMKTLKSIKASDIVFNNTITNGKFLRSAKARKTAVISYIHELDSVIEAEVGKKNALLTIHNSDVIVCPSRAVADNLVRNHCLDEAKIEYLPYFFEATVPMYDEQRAIHKKTFFSTRGIPEGKFYVAGMGTATLRKGIDLFLEVAKLVNKLDRDICFVWLGGFEDQNTQSLIEKRVSEYKLGDLFTVTGKLQRDPYNLSPFDLLFLSSREDPYPLVVLEAAWLKIPSLYFEDSGGIGEFVDQDAGWGIASLDLQEAAKKILYLKSNKAEVEKKGEKAFEKVKLLHNDHKLVDQKFDDIINNSIKNKR